MVGVLPAVPAHDLHNEGSLMGVGRADDGVDGLDDPVQSRVRTDGHVCATEIIVNGSYLQKGKRQINHKR